LTVSDKLVIYFRF